MARRALLALALFGACVAPIVAQDCQTYLKGWDQCGGKSNCGGAKSCDGESWKGFCCPVGYHCSRNDDWYHNCQPDGGQGGGGGGNPPPPPPSNGNPTPPPPSNGGGFKPAPPVPTKKVGSDWDWGQALGLSFLFYEAQRSGKLPANNRISWRGDSGLDHKGPDGRDVTGGWYDAGDNVKFNLPMAWSAHVLGWSLVDFADGYFKAGQLGTGLANVKWVTDYFIKCIGDRDVVIQVGSGSQDHGVWGRPEDIRSAYPSFSVTADKPGSDAVGAMGAALGAAAVAFAAADPAYSKQLTASAVKAYTFASKNLGKYSDSVNDAAAFYRSSNMFDDIALNAIWLYIATGDAVYKQAAYDWYMRHYKEEDGPGVWDNFDWDSNSWAACVLLQRYFPNDPILSARITRFVRAWTQGSDIVHFTPKGLAYSGPWGSLRHVGNAMFLLKAWAVGSPNANPAIKQVIDCTVRKQLGYIIGDTGRSFVVGYGTNPPQRPHHRASSCPPLGQECNWNYYNTPNPNPNTLYGALVGGPGASDDYNDDRNDYIKNEVATDYNAGFTGALAAAARGLLPCPANSGADTPVFGALAATLPPLAIRMLPETYIQQAMKTVTGEYEERRVVPLPQLPAAEPPVIAPVRELPLPAPVVVAPQEPVAVIPPPAPVRAPPKNLCFTWNELTHAYEATTPEAREFLNTLLGASKKEAAKGHASIASIAQVGIAARRAIRPPVLGAEVLPVPAAVPHVVDATAPVKADACPPCACDAKAAPELPLSKPAAEATAEEAPVAAKAPEAEEAPVLRRPVAAEEAEEKPALRAAEKPVEAKSELPVAAPKAGEEEEAEEPVAKSELAVDAAAPALKKPAAEKPAAAAVATPTEVPPPSEEELRLAKPVPGETEAEKLARKAAKTALRRKRMASVERELDGAEADLE